jgi:hypothetical protein
VLCQAWFFRLCMKFLGTQSQRAVTCKGRLTVFSESTRSEDDSERALLDKPPEGGIGRRWHPM